MAIDLEERFLEKKIERAARVNNESNWLIHDIQVYPGFLRRNGDACGLLQVPLGPFSCEKETGFWLP